MIGLLLAGGSTIMCREMPLKLVFHTRALLLIVLLPAWIRAADSPPGTPPAPATQPVPLLSAEDAIAQMHVARGFRVEVVATEPMVEHPVDIKFDPDGRMWVA